MSINITREAAEKIAWHCKHTAKSILKSEPNLSKSTIAIVSDLYDMRMRINKLTDANAFNSDELFNMTGKVCLLRDRASSKLGEELLANLTVKMNELQIKATKQKPPVAERIASHMDKAKKSLPIRISTFSLYPYTKEAKERAFELRKAVDSIDDFSKESPISEICTEITPMKSCCAFTACAMGNREKMEDRSLAESFYFDANGNKFSAHVFGVFDGHGGSKTVDHVTQNLVDRLQKMLEQRLKDKDPNEDAIFHALKETISSLHADCISAGFADGTTATVGFKLEGIEELWIANIGDSCAYVNRQGETIPMSILQKPLYFGEQPNEYAYQLGKNEVTIFNNDPEIAEQVRDKEIMVMSRIKTIKNVHELRLGLPNGYRFHLDMARSIGDPEFARYTKHTPEIFRLALQPGDQLIMFTDGVPHLPKEIVHILESDKKSGCSLIETVECLVQASIPDGDNVCAMIVTLDKAKKQFQSEPESNPINSRSNTEKLEKVDQIPLPIIPNRKKNWIERRQQKTPLIIGELGCNT